MGRAGAAGRWGCTLVQRKGTRRSGGRGQEGDLGQGLAYSKRQNACVGRPARGIHEIKSDMCEFVAGWRGMCVGWTYVCVRWRAGHAHAVCARGWQHGAAASWGEPGRAGLPARWQGLQGVAWLSSAGAAAQVLAPALGHSAAGGPASAERGDQQGWWPGTAAELLQRPTGPAWTWAGMCSPGGGICLAAGALLAPCRLLAAWMSACRGRHRRVRVAAAALRGRACRDGGHGRCCLPAQVGQRGAAAQE